MLDELVALAMLEERRRRIDAAVLLKNDQPVQDTGARPGSLWERLRAFVYAPGAVVVPSAVGTEGDHLRHL